MKRKLKLAILALTAVLCCCSCNPYLKLELRSAALKEVNLFSNPVKAVVALDVYNPSRELEITEIQGTLKLEEKALLHFKTDTLLLERRSLNTDYLNLELTLAEGVGDFSLMGLLQAQDLSTLSVDVSATTKDCLGIRHRKQLVDFKLSELKK